ncbi:hypothetical protein GCM10009778_26000 [Microbacterium terricola]
MTGAFLVYLNRRVRSLGAERGARLDRGTVLRRPYVLTSRGYRIVEVAFETFARVV